MAVGTATGLDGSFLMALPSVSACFDLVAADRELGAIEVCGLGVGED